MIDSVLKGTGNSRFLKSAVPAGTSWADALAMLQAGTFPIDFNGINTEGFQQVGTPLNKANLLKDATAAQIGLPPSTTPDGMFQALGNTGELHVWRKTVANGTGTYSLGAVQEGLHYIKRANYATSDSSVGTFEYGSEVSVDNDGAITGIKNPSTITIKPWYDDVSKANVFKGKFIKMISQVEANMSSFNIGEIWWIPADATMTTGLVNGAGNTRYIAASKRQQVIGIPAGTTTTYPVSTNPNAYQEGDDAKAAGYVVGEEINVTINGMNGPIVLTGDSLTVADDGTLSVASPAQYGVYNSSTTESVRSAVAGKYIYIPYNSGSVGFFKVPSNVIVTFSTASTGGSVFAFTAQPVTGYAAIPAGTTIEYLGKLGDKARVQVVSYVGTGTYGVDNPNSLTFDFVPKCVFLQCVDYGPYRTFLIRGAMYVNFKLSEGTSSQNHISWNSKTVSWYSTSYVEYQYNEAGRKYIALAIG